MLIVLIENEIIDLILKEEPGTKVEQALVFDEDKKYNVITVFNLLNDGYTKKWSMPIQNWGLILSHFLTIFEKRIQL